MKTRLRSANSPATCGGAAGTSTGVPTVTTELIARLRSATRVSAIRGVNVDGVIRTLVARGLINEAGTDPQTSATTYGTTELFLERLGLNSLDELPPLGDFVPGPDVVEALEAGLRVNEDSAHDAPAQSAAHEAAAHEAAAPQADEPVIDLRDQAAVNEAPLSLDALDVLADD